MANNLVKIIEAAGKKKESENKLKTELYKAMVESAIRRKEKQEEQKGSFALKRAENMMDNPQQYTPEQMYLRRRFMAENPLASMSIPEEGGDVSSGITYPKDEVQRDDKTSTFSVQPITQDRQAQLLTTKIDQMIAQGKRPHPAIIALADKMRGAMAQKKNAEISREDRLNRQNQLTNLRQYGGTVTDDELRQMGVGIEQYAKAGGATATITPDGKRVWEIQPYEQFKKSVSEGKWNKTEIDYFQNNVIENQRWKDVLDQADELGIGEEDIAYLGEIEFDPINTPYGPLSIPAKFNLAGQYLKDPKYTSMKRKIEMAFQAFRKRVTGAQAGEKELEYLRNVMPLMKDRPEVFFQTIRDIMDGNLKEMESRIQGYKAFGRDTSGIESLLSDFRSGNQVDKKKYVRTATNPVTKKKMGQLANGEWEPFNEVPGT